MHTLALLILPVFLATAAPARSEGGTRGAIMRATPGGPDVLGIPADRPLTAVLDAAMSRLAVNRARRVKFEGVSGGPNQIRFTLVNTASSELPIRIGILHLKEGDYDVYAAGPIGSGTHLSSSHLAGGWRFVLPAPQTATPFGRYVRRLAGSVHRTRLLLATRAEPEITKALIPLEAAVKGAAAELARTRRTDVSIVPSGTRFVRPPVESPLLTEGEIRRLLAELARLQRDLVAATDQASDRAVGSRIRRWFAFQPPAARSQPHRR